MPRHNSNEIEIQRKGRGTREALRGAYIQGCEAVISRLEGGPNWFLPVAGADEKRKSGQAGGKRRGRGRSGFNILIKATRGFVAARRRWTFQAWTNGRPHTAHPRHEPGYAIWTPPSLVEGRQIPSVFHGHVDPPPPSWLQLSSTGSCICSIDDGNFN